MKLKTILLGLLLLVVLVFVFFSLPNDAYSVKDGRFSYSQNRPVPKFNSTLLEDQPAYSLTKISFESHGAVVYSLLRLPKNVQKPPVVIILPGATVPKEARQNLGKLLETNGIASLVLDERGNGETTFTQQTQGQELEAFRNNEEVNDARMTLDVLNAFDLLKAFSVNRDKVVLLGESMGGRYAILSAAIDPRFAGAIIISSSGYGLPNAPALEQTNFIRLIDPDNYVSLISPRPVLFIHSPGDKVIPLASSKRTFSLAKEPKEFFTVNCPHGYCTAMDEKIVEWLKKNSG